MALVKSVPHEAPLIVQSHSLSKSKLDHFITWASKVGQIQGRKKKQSHAVAVICLDTKIFFYLWTSNWTGENRHQLNFRTMEFADKISEEQTDIDHPNRKDTEFLAIGIHQLRNYCRTCNVIRWLRRKFLFFVMYAFIAWVCEVKRTSATLLGLPSPWLHGQ